MNAAMTARAVAIFLIVGPCIAALAGETPQPTLTQPRVLVSPSSRQVAHETAPSTVSAQDTPVSKSRVPVVPPEQELKPVIERVRELEAEVRTLQAALADMRRENAAAISAMRSQHATLRNEYDKHEHFLDTGCIPSQTIAPGSKYWGCVFVHGKNGSMNPMTTAPIKYGN
jgi:hypothetical protein